MATCSDSGNSQDRVSIARDMVGANRISLVSVVGMALVSTAGTLAVPLTVKYIVSSFARGQSVLVPIVSLIVAATVAAVTSAGSAYILARVGESILLGLRNRVISRSFQLPLKSVEATGIGNLVSRITSDATLLRSVIDVGIVQLPLAVLTVGFTVVVMAVLDWVLVLITIGSFAISGGIIAFILKRVRHNVLAQQTAIGGIADRFTSYLTSLTTVKSNQAEEQVSRELGSEARDLMKVSVVGARLQSTISPVVTLGQQIALVAVIVGGGMRIASGDLLLGDFAAFIMYLLQLVGPVVMGATGVGRLQAGLAARTRFDELLGMRAETDYVDEPVTGPSEDAGACISFEKVTFSHRPDHRVLDHVSFSVPSTGVTALVGPSGVGKTSALMLIERFMDADGGSVRVLGNDVRSWSLHDLRSRIAYVDQRSTLVEGSIRDNLQLGMKSEQPDALLWGALDRVGLREDVAALPAGLDSEIGAGNDLSGGQRQRVALARALVSGREIVILDEPTSQLDTLNEAKLRDAVTQLGATRAVLVVAHRLSTVKDASHVIMLREGGVAGAGRHGDLMSVCEPYRAMVLNQTSERDMLEAPLPA